jgi:hypothetical protein
MHARLNFTVPYPQELLKYIDILVFVEGTIYQMDEENEALAAAGEVAESHRLAGNVSPRNRL